MSEQATPLAENLWMVGHYHYNLYLVEGRDRTALVEVGVSAVVDTVIGQLEALGRQPDILVVSHPHADHLTGLAGLRERYPQAEVVLGAGTREFAEHPKAVENLADEDRYMHEILAREGHRSERPPLDGPPSMEGARLATDGERLDLGGLTLEFAELKGHSPGHLGVRIPEREAALVSDALGFYFPGRGFWPMFFTGYRDYEDTLARLEGWKPQVLGLGHQGALRGDDVPQAFQGARAALHGFMDEVRAHAGDLDAWTEEKFRQSYKDELVINSERNIRNCVKLLIRRCQQAMA
ncbi:MAG: hypothetical protein Kow0092_31380 [Deferrisomatales bacterium]